MIRYLLHLEANREEDRLLFEHQINIAKKLFPTIENPNQAAEKLMHRYYRSSFTISEINSTLIQSFKEKIGLTKSTKKSRIDKNFYSQKIGYQCKSIIKKLGEKNVKSGQLSFFLESKQSIDIPQGTAVAFPSFMSHCVEPVTKGERWSLVCWVAGAPFR